MCEEEGVGKTMLYELTKNPISKHLHCLGEGGRRVRSEIEPGEKGVAG